jgi:hypothetical protein
MKLSSKIKTLFENNLMSFERRSVLKRLQSMIMEDRNTSERGSSKYGCLCDKGTCLESDV